MRRAAAFLILVVAGIAISYCLTRSRQPERQQDDRPQPIVDRRPDLRKSIAEQEVESAQSVAKYQPKIKGRIDDLAVSAADILRNLPGVVEVEVGVKVEKPTSRIIHIRDWHFVPKDLYAIDLAQAHGRSLSQEEIDLLHEQLLLEVELVQIEQMAILRCLIRDHGLKKVFAEGFSPQRLDVYKEKIAVLRDMEKNQIPELRKQLADVQKLLDGATGERREKAKSVEAELVGLLDQHKHRLLEMGAAGRLLISGELEDVLPLEDAAALENAKPPTISGVRPDPAKIEARHDAQVKAVMKEGPVGVIILGGSHDLTGGAGHRHGDVDYLRVTTKRFREIGE